MEATAERDWDATVRDLCRWLSDGGTLRSFCRKEGNPDKTTLYEWIEEAGEEVKGRIARARLLGADAIADEALAIADDGSADTIDTEEGGSKMDAEWVARSRLRVETRLKLLAKWFPQNYGDRQQVEHSGGVSLNVVTGVPEPQADADGEAGN